MRPQAEFQELVSLYEAKGLSRDTAQTVAKELTAHGAFAAHVDAELHIDPDELLNPWHAGLASGRFFFCGRADTTSGGCAPYGVGAHPGHARCCCYRACHNGCPERVCRRLQQINCRRARGCRRHLGNGNNVRHRDTGQGHRHIAQSRSGVQIQSGAHLTLSAFVSRVFSYRSRKTTPPGNYSQGDTVKVVHYGREAIGCVVEVLKTPQNKHKTKVTVAVGSEIVDAKPRKVRPAYLNDSKTTE